jgi:diguanylate cyclase (GGDEF)-like protein/PAS domain S-box-containing protein
VARLRLESNLDAPAAARDAIANLADQLNEDVLERATLLASEAVTNSVRHADGDEVRVEIWPMAGSVAVVVADDGPGFTPTARHGLIADCDGGFGLPLLDTLSESWGSGTDDESWVWFEVSPRIIARPVHDLLSARETQAEQLLDVRMVVDSMDQALVALDPTGLITNWGAVAEDLTGYSASEMLGRPLSEIYVPTAAKAYEHEVAEAITEGWRRGERWIRRKDNEQVWVDVVLAPIVDRAGTLRGLSARIADATALKRIQSEREATIAGLRQLAMTDELTSLPNRRRWSEELNRDLARARRYQKPVVVAMLDLDGFKAYNDTNGHPAGDELLRDVGRKWAEAVRATDLLARVGGDEFSITLPDCLPEEALMILDRVQSATPGGIGSSAGIASSDGSESADSIVARADAALYEAKRLGQLVVVAG